VDGLFLLANVSPYDDCADCPTSFTRVTRLLSAANLFTKVGG
jgi:hypothetical protein